MMDAYTDDDPPTQRRPEARRARILRFLRENGPSQAYQVVKAVGDGGGAEPVYEELRAPARDGFVVRERKDFPIAGETKLRTIWSVAEVAAEEDPPEIRAEVCAQGPTLRGDPPPTSLALRHTIGAMVLTFAESEREIRACFAKMVETEQRLVDTFGGHMSIEAGHHGTSFQRPDDTMRDLRRHAYQRLAEKLEIRRAMSIRAAEELDYRLGIKQNSLTVRDFPELTEANVWAWFEPYAVTIPEMFAEAMREVWDWLRPREPSRWDKDYKTNHASRLVLGEHLILTGIVERGYGRDRWRLCDYAAPRLLALENTFSMLDGKGGISKTYRGAVSDAIAAATGNDFDAGPYFKGKVYKNGNMHLSFKRMDLVRELNKRAGGMNFKPGPEEPSLDDFLSELRAGIEGATLEEEEREGLLDKLDQARSGFGSMRAARIWARDLVWSRELRSALPARIVRRIGLDPVTVDPPEAEDADAEPEEEEPATVRRPLAEDEESGCRPRRPEYTAEDPIAAE